jgi:hypothetical protein
MNNGVTRVAMSLKNSSQFGFGVEMGRIAAYFTVGIVASLGLLGLYAGMEDPKENKPRNVGLIIAGSIGILLAILIPFLVPRMLGK